MRVALLGAANSTHILKWANGLAEAGLEVHLISLHSRTEELNPNVIEHKLRYGAPAGYIGAYIKLRKLLRLIQPDILNAHYASGYGLLARLVKFSPYLLSIWGDDVYEYPSRGILQRWVLRKNLSAATTIGSTSHVMAKQVRKYINNKSIYVIPFGIDVEGFSLVDVNSHPDDSCVIGTVKALEHAYGIDTLIRAFFILIENAKNDRRLVNKKLVLQIVGAGSEQQRLVELVKELGIEDSVEFTGSVAHDAVSQQLAKMDIFVALSRRESFGVAILEACSCGLPVVVSSADGPAEIVINDETGFVVDPDHPEDAAARIYQLIVDKELRKRMGSEGRSHVEKHYMWKNNINQMIEAYKETISAARIEN